MRVCCRWPGGMDLALPRPGAAPLVVHLEGPPGQPAMLPEGFRGAPSRDAAVMLHKRVVDTVKVMKDTAGTEMEQWRETQVPDAFWQEWLALNAETDAVRDRMVFTVA